jgi:hypothetical protein
MLFVKKNIINSIIMPGLSSAAMLRGHNDVPQI